MTPVFTPSTVTDMNYATKAEIRPGLLIAGISAYSETIEVDGNSGTISFDAQNKTLTLADATITSTDNTYAIESSLQNLTIIVKGINKLSSGRNAIHSNNTNGVLNINQYDSTPSSILLLSGDNLPAINGFNSFNTSYKSYDIDANQNQTTELTWTYSEDALKISGGSDLQNVIFSSITPSGFTIGGVRVTNYNANDIKSDNFILGTDGKVSYADGVLTLKNATINGKIRTSISALTIDLVGSNTINSDSCAIKTDGETTLALTIKSSSNPKGTLSLKSSGAGIINDGVTITYNDGLAATPTSLTTSTNAMIAKDYCGLIVGGVLVTSENKESIQEGVKFDSANNILTLTNATISGNIESSISPLKVHMIGSSTITPTNDNDAPFQYTGTAGTTAATLTFESSEADDGELTLGGTFSKQEVGESDNRYYQFSSGNYTYSNPICAWYQKESFQYTRKTYTYWGVKGDNNNIIFYNAHYGITIGDYEVTKFNMDKVTGSTGDFTYVTDGSYLLVPNNNTLTGDYEIKSHRADLNIQISGDCTLKAIKFELNSEEFGTPETKTLNISASSSTSGKNSLTIDTGTDSSVPAISGFSSVNLSEDLHFVTPETAPSGEETFPAKVVISDEVTYDLWVEGQRVTSRNKDNVKGEASTDTNPITPSVVYDSSNYILTLNNATISVTTGNESNSAVVSGLENLTIKLVNNNSFPKNEDVTPFYGFKAQEDKTCNITFTAVEGGSCSIGTEKANAVSGFNEVTYNDGVAPFIWDDNFTIAPVTLEKPEFIGTYDEDSGKLLSVSIDCHATPTIGSSSETVNILAYDVVYTIDGGSETAYSDSEPITISGPCTLTAKTIVGNTSSEVATGKYFEPKKDAFTMAIGESLDDLDWCTPSFDAETESLICKFISESSIFNYDEDAPSEAISTKASGTGTVNVELSYNDAMVTQILNNIDGSIATLTINVGEALSSVFEGENTYGAIYSETAIQVPEGMTAYVITGIDEETGSVKTSDPLDFIPAKTAVLLEKGTDAIAITHVPYTGTATAPTNNKLNYSDPNSPAKPSTTDNWYVLYNNKFVKVTTNTEVKGGKCYLNLNGTAAGTRGFYNIGNGEGTTAIREVKNGEVKGEKWGNGEWFDLQGRRLNAKPNKSGLYILNGKKIVIK